METPSILFWLAIAFLLYRVVMAAMRCKGDVKAGGTVGQSSFYLEFKERRHRDTRSADR